VGNIQNKKHVYIKIIFQFLFNNISITIISSKYVYSLKVFGKSVFVIKKIPWSAATIIMVWCNNYHSFVATITMVWCNNYHGVMQQLIWCDATTTMVWCNNYHWVMQQLTWCDATITMVWCNNYHGVQQLPWCDATIIMVWCSNYHGVVHNFYGLMQQLSCLMQKLR